MEDFQVYYDLGFHHIFSTRGIEHMLLISAIFVLYLAEDWKYILLMLTAFTVGHSVGLVFATFSELTLPVKTQAFIQASCVFCAAAYSLFAKSDEQKFNTINYIIAIIYAISHAFGSARNLKYDDGSDQLAPHLFSFNVGLEVGQIVVIVAFMTLGFVVVGIANVERRDWKMVISSAIAGVAVMLILDSGFL